MGKLLKNQIWWGQWSPSEASQPVGNEDNTGQTRRASPVSHFLGRSTPWLLEEMMNGESQVKPLPSQHDSPGMKFKGTEQGMWWRRGFQTQGLGYCSPLITPAPHSTYCKTGNRKKGFACPHSCICLWCQSHAAQVTNSSQSGALGCQSASAQWFQAQDWPYWLNPLKLVPENQVIFVN